MNSDTAILINNLSKAYKLYRKPGDRLKEALNPFGKKYHKSFFALQGISMEVKKGEAIGIIGKNGSGKSTLLKIITGVLSPTSGSLVMDGKVSALLELGAGFNAEMTGRENIYLNGSMMGYSRAEIDAKVPEILEFADIGDFVDQQVKTYSSGMFTRLAFALAINVDPDILIVDEALAVGDMAFQLKCYKKIMDFRNAGKTILMVSHSMDSILRYCDRALVLNNGEMIGCGNTKEMVDIYKRVLANYAEPPTHSSTQGKPKTPSVVWKDSMNRNPSVLSYGDGSAEIVDYGILNDASQVTSSIHSDDVMTIVMRVRFCREVKEPVFAFTIKDIKGNEIAGTNTMYEFLTTGTFQAGEEVVVAFEQNLSLCSGGYAVSFGCVCFISGEFYVLHRLYDAVLLEIFSDRQTVGVVRLNTQIEITRT